MDNSIAVLYIAAVVFQIKNTLYINIHKNKLTSCQLIKYTVLLYILWFCTVVYCEFKYIINTNFNFERGGGIFKKFNQVLEVEISSHGPAPLEDSSERLHRSCSCIFRGQVFRVCWVCIICCSLSKRPFTGFSHFGMKPSVVYHFN